MHITIGSMKKNGTISEDVISAAKNTKHVVLQTGTVINNLDFLYSTLDDLYEEAIDFDDLIKKACKRLLIDGTLFVTLGDPCQNNIAIELANKVVGKGASLDVIPFGNDAIAIAMQKGLLKSSQGIFNFTATSFDTVTNTDAVLVIDEINSQTIASELKLELSRYYSDEHKILFADTKEHTGQLIELFELDAQKEYGYFTSVVLPTVDLEQKVRYTFMDLICVMDKLRSKNGCPWDKQQTHESLKRYLVEESYEVLEAIDENDMNALFDELGDVMLQIVFHAKIAQQYSEFDISDVTSAICTKMISRHTHIFGSDTATTPSDVIKNWEVIKKEEKSHLTQTDVLRSVPKSMPALLRSCKVQHKAAHVGFDFRQVSEALDKLREEIVEVEQDIAAGKDIQEECGDLLFSVVNVVRMLDVEPETTLQKATDKFIKRFSHVEKSAIDSCIDLKNSSLEVLEEIWDEAKKYVD